MGSFDKMRFHRSIVSAAMREASRRGLTVCRPVFGRQHADFMALVVGATCGCRTRSVHNIRYDRNNRTRRKESWVGNCGEVVRRWGFTVCQTVVRQDGTRRHLTEQTVTENTIRNAAKDYDVEDILGMCNRIAVDVHRSSDGFVQIPWPKSGGLSGHHRVMTITLYAIALLAKIVACNHRYAGCVRPRKLDVLRLVNNCTTIDPPPSAEPRGKEWVVQTMVRLTSQQFSFQDDLHYMLPRHLLLFSTNDVSDPKLDLETLAKETWGVVP